MTELKPCPFCGKEVQSYITVCKGRSDDYIVAKIRCVDCDIEIKDHVNKCSSFDDVAKLEDTVISKWNRRTENGT